MMRRLICSLAIAASCGMATLLAQERATFILTDDPADSRCRDVAAFSLNPKSARRPFNVPARRDTPGATAGTVLDPGAVRVDANTPWNNTGINVRAGDLVSFRTSGRIAFGQG